MVGKLKSENGLTWSQSQQSHDKVGDDDDDDDSDDDDDDINNNDAGRDGEHDHSDYVGNFEENNLKS